MSKFVYCFSFFLIRLLSAYSEEKVFAVTSQPAAIETFSLDEEKGQLIPIQRLELSERPMTIAVSNDRRHLYVGARGLNGKGKILTLRMSDHLKVVDEIELDFQVRYMEPAQNGKDLLFADYFGGQVGVLKVQEGVVTSEVRSLIKTDSHAHCIRLSHDQAYAYVPHTAPNKCSVFEYDKDKGSLSFHSVVEGPSGNENNRAPRHLDLHPTRPYLYTSNEHKGGVSFWSWNDQGELSLKQTLSSLPSDFIGKSTAADIHVTPDGRYVYVSNRGGKGASSKNGVHTLAAFAIDEMSGELKAVGHTPVSERPRSFVVTTKGDYVMTAGQNDKKLMLLKIDQHSGQLNALSELLLAGKINWVVTY